MAPLICPRLFLNHIAGLDWLIALEFGRVDDGQPADCWHGVSDQVGLLHARPGGRVLGFKVVGVSDVDLESDEHEPLWDGPRFDVPALGLTDVPAGPVIAAARSWFAGGSSVNRLHFDHALSVRDTPDEIGAWRMCLESGDSMAHFGLGCALLDAGAVHEAYRHLRHYAELAPAIPWNWCWYGRAAQACGLLSEARTAFTQAVALDDEEETDAEELLAALD